jgi:MOSC domain-containing protein YiiM
MELVSVNVGVPRSMGDADAGDWMHGRWTSAIFKNAVAGRLYLGRLNLIGDRQADLENHGGIDKAVNAYPSEHYALWRSELRIAEMPWGAFGENFTTGGLLEDAVCIGDVFDVGKARVQVSQPRQPCWKLARRWQMKDLAVRLQETGRTGWYFRVLAEGFVEAGAKFVLIERTNPEWTVAAANEVKYRRKEDLAAAQKLADCPGLSAAGRESMLRRAESLR